MTNHPPILAGLKTYADLLSNLIAHPPVFSAEVEDATSVQIERGGFLGSSVLTGQPPANNAVERLIELSNSHRLPDIVVVDRTGHHRPAYRSLLVYSWLASFRLIYETLPRDQFGRWEEGLRPWVDGLEGQLGLIDWPVGLTPAARGVSAVEAAWAALCLYVAGKIFIRDAWTDLAADAFGRLVRGQSENGAFLSAGPSDNPETAWYHELIILHAAAAYAVQAEDRTVAAAVARNTVYHLNETQPDHATTQPWGIFAFIWNPATHSLADQSLHAVQTQHPNGIDGVSLMLLADALYCLRLFF